jgi:tRNA-specific 2-thiouridylase
LKKTEVRELAKEAGLPNWAKKDSQGICFLGRIKIQNFLSDYIQSFPGEIVSTDGRILGKHDGLFRFTIGQRHGMNLPSNTDFKHYVVVGKDLKENRLIVELENQNSQLLYGRSFSVHALSFVNKPLGECETLLARPRYRDPATKIEFRLTGNTTAQVTFRTPQRAIAPGQIIAFYDSETLVGGAVFA